MATEYACNVVLGKLFNLVDSPPEQILGRAVFDQLSKLGRCWVHSEFEFRTFGQQAGQDFVIVPQLHLPDVGRVDYAVFVPQVSMQEPLLVIEIDGHDYHRTPEQASNDHRRDRALTRRPISYLRFTATDVLRNSTEHAREIAEFVRIKLQEKMAREAELAAAWDDGYQYGDLLS